MNESYYNIVSLLYKEDYSDRSYYTDEQVRDTYVNYMVEKCNVALFMLDLRLHLYFDNIQFDEIDVLFNKLLY